MASLYKTKHHGWKVRYFIYFLSGAKKEKKRYHKNRSDAIVAHSDAERLEILSAKHRLTSEDLSYFLGHKYLTREEAAQIVPEVVKVEHERVTWETLAKVYKEHVASVGSTTTRHNYPYLLPRILEFFSSLEPLRVSEDDVKRFKAWCRGKGLAKSSFNKYRQVLVTMFDHLVHKSMMSENPARKVRPFGQSEERTPRILYSEEMAPFLRGIRDQSHLLYGYFSEIMLTYVYTGMRRRELITLRTSNVNLQQKYLVVRTETDIKRGRKIDIHPHLVPVFQSVLLKNDDFRKANAQDRNLSTEYFFGGLDVPLCREDAVTACFERFRNRAQIPKGVTLHSLRHTFTTYLLRYLLQNGYDIKQAMSYTGHKKLSTIDRYLHLIPSEKSPIDGLTFPGILLEEK